MKGLSMPRLANRWGLYTGYVNRQLQITLVIFALLEGQESAIFQSFPVPEYIANMSHL